MPTPHVWLSYVAYPVTTAVYFERALRKTARVTTVGPPFPAHLIDAWQLNNLKLPFNRHDITTEFTADLNGILSTLPEAEHPDLFLWVESVGGHYPQNMDALSCPRACYLIDSHLNLPTHLDWARHFDFVFIAQREYLEEFRSRGIRTYWLPLGCDPEIHCRFELPKQYPVGFVGGVQSGSRRERLLTELSGKVPVYYERCFWDDMARLFSQSKIVFNEAVRNDLNMRVFEAMSTGTMLLTDMAVNSGQSELFMDGEDYAVYRDQNLTEVARFYLENEDLREQVAARGRQLVHNAHTYDHRIRDLLAVSLQNKPDTWSASELRERSLAGVAPIDSTVQASVSISSAARSFVIPVLDMSPASEYNIITLLDDLRDIEGDVIVIFNDPGVAEELKSHPRITRFAIMKHNVGVSRAWNLGLEIAATPVVFIMNADLHVRPGAITTVEKGLLELPGAGCVGPQGCFFDFTLAADYLYFDKGTFEQPIKVDAVSGFFFAVKLQHFNEKTIRFENAFTPCYFEEWDLGLQLKKAGLSCYVVPTPDYDHHWSGSIRALREICYYENAATAGEILTRNRRLFLNKWRATAGRENCRGLLESSFFPFVEEHAGMLIAHGDMEGAKAWLDDAAARCLDSSRFASLRRFVGLSINKSLARDAIRGEQES